MGSISPVLPAHLLPIPKTLSKADNEVRDLRRKKLLEDPHAWKYTVKNSDFIGQLVDVYV